MTTDGRRVVHVTSVHPTFDIRIFEKQCKSLARAGFDVTLIAPGGRCDRVDGVSVLGVQRATSRLRRIFGTARRAVMQARREPADLYHLHDPELLLWAPLLRLLRVPVVFDMHENLIEGLAEKPYIPARLHRTVSAVGRVAQRLLLAGLPVVFAEDSYVAHYPWVSNSIVIRNYPIVAPMTELRPSKHVLPSVAYVGAVSPDRGVEVTLQALAILRDRGCSVGFECVGPFDSPAEQRRIEQLATDLELERVHFHGYQRFQEAIAVVARCHVGLAVLASRPNLRDSLPTKIFDYVALGLSVVASDFPLHRTLVDELRCGVVVDPSSPDQVADAIAEMLDSTSNESLQESGSRLVSRYDWDQTEAVRLLDFYRDLIDGSAVVRG